MKTQLEQIQDHLINHGKITNWGAFSAYRITRLAHYIYLLRQNGWDIPDEWVMDNGRKWKIYRLEKASDEFIENKAFKRLIENIEVIR